jgi:hypothetical protein
LKIFRFLSFLELLFISNILFLGALPTTESAINYTIPTQESGPCIAPNLLMKINNSFYSARNRIKPIGPSPQRRKPAQPDPPDQAPIAQLCQNCHDAKKHWIETQLQS